MPNCPKVSGLLVCSLPTGNPFSVTLVGQGPKWDGGVCRIRTGETCLEGRCVTTTLIRHKGHPKLTMSSLHGYKLLVVASLTKRKVSNDGGHCRWNGWGSWIRTNGRLSHARVKVWCLTAWRYPNILKVSSESTLHYSNKNAKT